MTDTFARLRSARVDRYRIDRAAIREIHVVQGALRGLRMSSAPARPQ